MPNRDPFGRSRAYGKVRASLQRFEQLGYIEPNQRIGRSELYVPTPAMKRGQ